MLKRLVHKAPGLQAPLGPFEIFLLKKSLGVPPTILVEEKSTKNFLQNIRGAAFKKKQVLCNVSFFNILPLSS